MVGTELISQSIIEWLQGLNYQYMAIVAIISYGLRFKESMSWLNNRLGGEIFSKWWVGIIIAATEIISTLPMLGGHGVDLNTFILLFHSYLIIMIFCDDITDRVHNWFTFFAKKNQNGGQL